jgi:hypothetical protein
LGKLDCYVLITALNSAGYAGVYENAPPFIPSPRKYFYPMALIASQAKGIPTGISRRDRLLEGQRSMAPAGSPTGKLLQRFLLG